ncbi:Lactonase, 7-bladed beta propeller [Kalmanozyma brasiliensis GHG001]|uniref:Muconate cycloisomerase n=1 Tax=Kalmanozyma brasiliensis (strain GHG001) TaxID=1365824 RepID=V5EP98_KALBG|nr:Lactonase, 7-bladed beta propeller [Kalmanozyma brasiliensis GHG001]EST04758.1 Lactonase, 7-bladed beta propeller [Kalmanozyma brasiliensis GHG001]
MSLLAVGTFNTNELFTVRFDPKEETLELLDVSAAKGNHSWLSTATLPKTSSRDATAPTHLYATCWTQPPSVAAYRIDRSGPGGARFELLNTAETAARSGYVYVGFPEKAHHPVLYTCGGPTGEVVGIDSETGAFDLAGTKHKAIVSAATPSDGVTGVGPAGRIQEIDFVTGECSMPGKTLAQTKALKQQESHSEIGSEGTSSDTGKLDASNGKNAMDFGGLRHGSHGIDLSPDGTVCYVPDIGRNCVWTMDVDPNNGALSLGEKSIAPRSNDGPRHTISHPDGRYIYSLQEHSSMVDVFELIKDARGTRLEWRQGVKIIPRSDEAGLYWADEVRLSHATANSDGEYPLYMFASTRGLASGTKGWVAVFELDKGGLVVPPPGRNASDELGDALCLWQTPTSGGWANAIEPAPTFLPGPSGDGIYAALTDSEVGELRMLRLDVEHSGETHQVVLREVATLKLGNDAQGRLREAATAVWI